MLRIKNYSWDIAIRFYIPILLCILLIMNPQEISASSEALLKGTADLRYEKLVQCIKLNENDISSCINEAAEYFKAEIQYVKASEQQEEVGKRLDKMVDYLKKSADIFFNKAQETHDVLYYEKASRCASLLVKLSDKYQEYQQRVETYNNIITCKKTTSALIVLLNGLEYPSAKFQKTWQDFVTYITQNYDYVISEHRTQATALGQDLVEKYLEHLNAIVNNLKNYKLANFEYVLEKFSMYEVAITIPDVISKHEESEQLRKEVSIVIKNLMMELQSAAQKIPQFYLENVYTDLNEGTKRLAELTTLTMTSYAESKPLNTVFIEFPEFSDVTFQTIQHLVLFLQHATQAINAFHGKDYVSSVTSWDSALNVPTIEEALRQKATRDRLETINVGVDETLKDVERLANNNEFITALQELDHILGLLPMNETQKKQMGTARTQLIPRAQKYVYDFAREKEKRGDLQGALDTLETAKIFGLTKKQRELYVRVYKATFPLSVRYTAPAQASIYVFKQELEKY